MMPTGQTINDILELPEEEIDLGLACLVLAKEFYPDIDINFYLKLIDGYAYNVKKINKGLEQPEARIGALNTCLYRKGKWNNNQFFEYDLDDLKGELRKNKFLNTYLDTKKGSCTTMPMLYLVIAQRLGWPIYAVIAPMHFFCRYVDPDFKENNIEPTVGGGYDDDLRYINEMGTTARTIENGVYMRTLSNKEYLGRLLIINALEYRKLGNIDKAISYLDTAVQIDSTDSGAIWNLCVCFYEKAKVLNKKMEFELQALQIEKELYETGMKKNEHLLYQHPNRSSIVAKGAQDIINAHGSGLDYHSTNNQNSLCKE
jgi:regulator of sirC expression with transglutaminase-like and TPR domain